MFRRKALLIAAVLCMVTCLSACGKNEVNGTFTTDVSSTAQTEAQTETEALTETQTDSAEEPTSDGTCDPATYRMTSCKGIINMPANWNPNNTDVQYNNIMTFPASFVYKNKADNIITIQVAGSSATKEQFDALDPNEQLDIYTQNYTNVEKISAEQLEIDGLTAYKLIFSGVLSSGSDERNVRMTMLLINSPDEGAGYCISLADYNDEAIELSENFQDIFSYEANLPENVQTVYADD